MAKSKLTPEERKRRDDECKRRWRENNRQYSGQYYLGHREKWLKPITPERREYNRQYNREYYLEHRKGWNKPLTPEQREYKRQRDREYCRKNAEKAKARAAAWVKANPQRARESHRAYALGPKREELREKRREYAAAHSKELVAKAAAWAATHPERTRELKLQAAHKRRARKLAAPGQHTHADILRLFERQHGHCVACNSALVKTGKGKYHVDHIMPLTRGGSDGPENLQLLCPHCNLRKNAKTPEQWAKEQGKLFI
jgi:5-methylcytosine-specific restriction endonuclease McrA